MFAKVFNQIYDSSIVENPEMRFTFMDFLVLADCNGVVDMTHEAISRRTNRPLELIRSTIASLESPDNHSRSPEFSGARLKRLDEHRDWGWFIVNFDKFRKIASEEQRREKTKLRVQKHRVTQCNAVKRSVNDLPSPSSSVSEIGEMQEGISTPAFQEAWKDWESHRREIKKPLTRTSRKQQLASLAAMGERRAIAAIRHTIFKGWQGIREPEAKDPQKNDLRAHEKKKYIPPAPIDPRTEEEVNQTKTNVHQMSEQLRTKLNPHLDCVGTEGCKASTETK